VKRAIVVGAGFAGATAARLLAEKGYEVAVLERRGAAGGNSSETLRPNGIIAQRYGPHLFHTKNEAVFRFLSRFCAWRPHEHRVLGSIRGALVPIPFNFRSIELLFPPAESETLRSALRRYYPADARAPVLALMTHESDMVKKLGEFVMEYVFLRYTAKQWGIPPSQVDRSVLDRVPVVMGYRDTYFDDPIQMMPQEGFNALFANMLRHPGIRLELTLAERDGIRLDAEKGCVLWRGAPFDGPVICTGNVDALLDWRFGRLPYRAVRFEFEDLPLDSYQPAAVVNYPNDREFTRITEFKKITGQQAAGATCVLREYPTDSDRHEPCYPVENPANRALYDRYAREMRLYSNIVLCGRLAEYRYYNMDQAVASAMDKVGCATNL
jgi:UDP-galactopyranose mutase